MKNQQQPCHHDVRQARPLPGSVAAVSAVVNFLGSTCALLLLVTGPNLSLVQAGDPREHVDFNRDVRPLLSRHCLSCHGPDEKNREGGLQLDDRRSATRAADSGEVPILPGQPDASELIRRVTTTDEDMRMPPEDAGERLTDDEIGLLRRWIEQGAEYAGHWAFDRPVRPRRPDVVEGRWPLNEIDYFVLQRLETEGLAPNPSADRYALLRRLSFDLRGLPPNPAEVDEFAADERPDAYEQVVERFLNDPAFGERWARVWLDLARYADSRGYGSDPLRTNMWRYRDWVIDAFNRNLPFDQFTRDQLAGDLLPDPQLEQRIATAFHRNTMTNTEGGTDDEEFRVEAVKDRVDTTIQVWMGLTMGCAKCHDHKYDPISQREYYQFFAIFNQTKDADLPDESPTIEAPRAEDLERLRQYDQQLAALNQQLSEIEQQQAASSVPPPLSVTGRHVRLQLPGSSRILSLAEVQVWQDEQNVALAGQATQSSTDYEGAAARAIDGNTNGDYFAANSTTHTKQQSDPWWEVDLGGNHAIARISVWNRADNGLQTRLAGLHVQVLDAARQVVWQTVITDAPESSVDVTPRELTPLEQRRQELERQIADVRKTRPAVPTVPVMEQLEPAEQRATYMLIKGNFLTRGEQVGPAVPASFHPLPPGSQADRLGVARWLTDPENPLTARVAVNRLWAQVFGTGLVATEEDFGTQGDPPSHPELLDWLATEFMRSGWDVKQMLRLMVTSATYRQSAVVRPELLSHDPNNRLLGRGPRYRLEAEMVRDQALALSGLLSRKIGGPSVYPYQPPGLWRAAFNGERTWPTSGGEDRYRRGLYTFWRRTVPYPSLATFDAPSREICTVRRVRTNTPLQAFVGLNDPVYVEAAQALARRIVAEGGSDTAARATFALRLCLCRPPAETQVDILAQLFDSEYAHYRQDEAAAGLMATDPLGPLPAQADVAEMAAWTVVANVLLNTDAVLNK